MASPAVVTTALSANATISTSHTINLPASIVSGNGLLIFFGANVSDAGQAISATGWTVIPNFKINGGGGAQGLVGLYRQADGAEGATVVVTSATACKSQTIAYQVSGQENFGTIAPECTTGLSGNGANGGNGPSVTVTGGPKDILVLTVMTLQGEVFPSANAPTNYSNSLIIDSGVGGPDTGNGVNLSAERQMSAASSEDPGTFTHAANEWCGQTVVIHPAAGGAATVTPAVVPVVTTFPTPAVLAAAKTTPAVIPVVAALPTPTIAAAAKVTPAVIPVVVTLPTPTIVVAGGPVTVTPATIPVVVTLPTPAVLAAVKVVPAVIPLAALLPTPTIVVASSATVTPATIAVVAALPTPTLAAAAVVTPAGITVIVTLPTPSTTSPGVVTPAGISLVVTLPTPGTIVGAMTFWQPNPVAFVPVGPGDTPPWN